MPVAQFSMDLARHSIKGATPDGNDFKTPLSTVGMEAAVQAGTERDFAVGADTDQSGVRVYGSPRERTLQSSILRALAQKFKDASFKGTPNTSEANDLDPQEMMNAFKEAGLDAMETPLLNFDLGADEYAKEITDNFKSGKYFKYLVEQSDSTAKKYKQDPDKVTQLSIQAGNVAYFLFGRVAGLYAPSSKKEQGSALTEFGTSHQGVLESFLYKVIKKHDGDSAAKEFVADLGNHGFKENMGFHVDCKVYDKKDTNEWVLDITYRGKMYHIQPEELYAIMQEGDTLKEELTAARMDVG